MAMGVGGSKGGAMNSINVTPMIDVLLVLLIIFMAVLPSMRKAIDIQLPDPNPTVAPANANSNQIVLEVKPGGGTVRVGTAIQLHLFAATRGGGTDLVPGNMAAWASSDETLAEMNRQGRLNPRRSGTVTVTASYAGQTAHATFTVAG